MSDLSSRVVRIEGKGIPLPGNDVDTDRIIPARFMKCVTFEDLGQYAFFDERFESDGTAKPHPFNDARFRDHDILVVNANFGCGSSREHAPQALRNYGIRALIGESFAEIFAGNCTAMGVAAVSVSHDVATTLMSRLERVPDLPMQIDLEARQVRAGDEVYACDMFESYRKSLVTGKWDTTAQLLANRSVIAETVARLPYIRNFAE